jgi:hypothetical protein
VIAARRERAEEDRELGRKRPSRARDVRAVLFWTLLAVIVLWNAPFLSWIDILQLAGLVIGLAMFYGAASAVMR